jgi:ABC-type ATPase involved in cell division
LTETQTPETGEGVVLRLSRASPRPAGPQDTRGLLSLTLDAGASHVLTGEPGSGKSAILEMIARVQPPARGGAWLFGQEFVAIRPRDRFAVRRRIGFMAEDLRLADELTAFDNVALAARAADRDPDDYEEPVREVLGWVGLRRQTDEPARGLDAEGRRRLALARAVINRPDLVVADEPDGGQGLAIARLLADLNRAGTAVLIATSDADLAASSGAPFTRLGAMAGAEA